MMDAGHVKIYSLENVAQPGFMPREEMTLVCEADFSEQYIGYGRQYAAKGVNEQIDAIVRIWREPSVRIGMVALLTDYEGQENDSGDQYHIDNVQPTLDDDGLKTTDITLSRLEDYYDI